MSEETQADTNHDFVKCEDCGCDNTPENPVTFDTDPFAEEIHNDYTKHWQCKHCRYQSAMDI